MQSNCIFASSKYYRQAYADASKVAEPLGYNFLSKKEEVQIKKQRGQLVRKIQFQKALIKPLSTKATPLQKLTDYLLVSDSKRKNTYLSANPLAICGKCSQDISQQLSDKYIPNIQRSMRQTLDFCLCHQNLSNDALFSVNNYSLSVYQILYFGRNSKVKSWVQNVYEEQFIEYQVDLVEKINCSSDQTDENQYGFDQLEINDKERIDRFIEEVKEGGKKKDLMYSGIHFFVGDIIAPKSTYDILKEEIQNLKYLQFYLYLLTSGVLGNGQNALIKIRGTMRHKTVDFLFLFKLIFNKVTLIKPPFSNFLSSEKYMFCQNYVSENGEEVHKFMSTNFDLLKQYGEEKLLVNPQLIFREEFLADNTKNFNDSLIVRGVKENVDNFLKNTNLEIYPPKTPLLEKLSSMGESDIIKELIQLVEKIVPSEQEINKQLENDKNGQASDSKFSKNFNDPLKPDLQEKQAEIDIFDLLKKTKDEAKPVVPQKPVKKNPVNEQSQIQRRIQQRFKEQQRIKEQKKKEKKEKEKQKKDRQKKDDDPYGYSSHFSYADG